MYDAEIIQDGNTFLFGNLCLIFFPVNLESGRYRGHFQAVSFSSQGESRLGSGRRTQKNWIRINHRVVVWYKRQCGKMWSRTKKGM